MGVRVLIGEQDGVELGVPVEYELGAKDIDAFSAMQEPTGFNRGDSDTLGTISFVNATRTFSIEPLGGQSDFSFWISGTEFKKTVAETIVIADVEGNHAIYFDEDGVLSSASNPSNSDVDTLIRESALVVYIYWSVANQEQYYFGEERHGINMDSSTHGYLHFTQGLQYLSGLAPGDFSLNQSGDVDSHAQFSLTSGGVADEDIYLAISSVASTTGLPVYYRSGVSGYWNREIEAGFSVTSFGSGRLHWNEYTGGTWTTSEITNNDFLLCHVFATTSIDYPLISIMGQADYGNLNQARVGANEEVGNLLLGGLPSPEITPIATIIFQSSNGYANGVQARVRTTDEGDAYIDWRTSQIQRTSAAGSHSTLSGLDNDDHLHYLPINGDRDMNTGYVPVNDLSVATKEYVDDNPSLPIDIIATGETYTIDENRHHVVMSKMTIEGTINIDGTLGVV